MKQSFTHRRAVLESDFAIGIRLHLTAAKYHRSKMRTEAAHKEDEHGRRRAQRIHRPFHGMREQHPEAAQSGRACCHHHPATMRKEAG